MTTNMTTTAIKTLDPPRSEMTQSPAYAALSKNAKRAITFVEAEIARTGTDAVAITMDRFVEGGICRSGLAAALRELRSLSFVTITTGARKSNVFRIADGWKDVASLDAARIAASIAREPPSKPSKPRKVTHYGGKPPKPIVDADIRRTCRLSEGRTNRRPQTSRVMSAASEGQAPRPITLATLAWPTRQWADD